jgi:hypothetical protein
MNSKRSQHSGGFSLVVSLIILTLLSVLVVSFLSSTALDRTTARAFLGKSQAEVAADTAVKQAISLLREHITQYPDSVTYWESLNAPTADAAKPLTVEGTMLYFNDQPMPTGYDTKPPSIPKRYMLPLMSRGLDSNTGKLLGSVPVEQKGTVMDTGTWTETATTDLPTDVDLNQARFNGDTAGWIGSPPAAPGEIANSPRPFRAKWINLKEKSNADGKTDDGKEPRTIARYAFWMEDETFKLNLNYLGGVAGGRGTEVFENSRIKTGDLIAQPLPPQLVSLIPLQGLLQTARAPAAIDRDQAAAELVAMRSSFFNGRAPEFRTFNQVGLGSASNAYRISDETKFLATVISGALNQSRHGSQRLNLNGLQLEKVDPTQKELTDQVRRIVASLRYHTPKLGQRFYRLQYSITEPTKLDDPKTAQELARRNAEQVSTTYPGPGALTTSHHDTYLYKIAANIRDYIDPDSQPTIVVVDPDASRLKNPEGKVMGSGDPDQFELFARQGKNLCWAQGKDAVPQIQEVVARFRSETTGGENYRLRIDYYVELWNMTDRPINVDAGDLGVNPFIRISNPVRWFAHKSGGGYGDPLNGMPLPNEPRDLTLNISGLGIIFPAGACTVITSAPEDTLNPKEFAAVPPFTGANGGGSVTTTGGFRPGSMWRVPLGKQIGKREFIGTIPQPTTNPKNDGFWPLPREPGNQEDYETEVTFGNSSGVLDCVGYAVSMGGGGNVTYKNATGTQKIARDDTYGGTLRGNSNSTNKNTPTPSQLGDPRCNNEQLSFLRYKTGGDPDQTRYFNPTVSDDLRFSLGWPNSRYVVPHLNSNIYVTGSAPYGYPWRDYYKVWPWTATDSSNVVPNPDADTAPSVVRNARLTSIGQLGDIFDPARILNITPTATLGIEYSRGGGRTLKIGQPDDLVDMLSSTEKAPSRGWAAWRLADFLGTSGDAFLPGVININGLQRDNGAAFRAACEGMKMKAVACPASTTTPTGPYERALLCTEGAATGVQAVIDQAILRMKANDPVNRGTYDAAAAYFGPFAERGEISELPLFNDANQKLIANTKMSETFDRGREELYRRLADQITTRGSVFSVYAIGQSIIEGPPPARQRRVGGTHAVKVTFALVPKKKDNSDFSVPSETFDPINTDATSSNSVQSRFARPDHYDVQILQVSLR